MEAMLQMLKIDLGITTAAYDERLKEYLYAAKDEITRQGATLDTENALADAQLCVMYAAWMWRKRDEMVAMPRMLRYALNNRIFSEKARG